MAINPDLLSVRLVNTASNACTVGDVVVDGRKLTEEQQAHLFAAIGRVFVTGHRMTRDGFDYITSRVVADETPSIDVMHIGNGSFITICRNNKPNALPMYYLDEDGYSIIDIFLPTAEYDALINAV